MRIEDRLQLARLAYQRAVTLAGARSTPANWQRVLTAARNLDDAARVRARPAPERRPAQWLLTRLAAISRPLPRAPTHLALVPGDARPRLEPPAPIAAAPDALRAEWARAKALVAEARRLVAIARKQQLEAHRVIEAAHLQQLETRRLVAASRLHALEARRTVLGPGLGWDRPFLSAPGA